MEQQKKANNISDLIIAQALTALIYASTWEKTLKVLEQRQSILLLDRSLELLNTMVIESFLSGEIDDGRNLSQYQVLLALARKDGVAAAWQSFSPLQ